MKKFAFFLFLNLPFLSFSQQQISIPEVPKKIDFAGVTIKFDLAAQDLIKKEVSTLLTPQNKYLTDKLERMQWYLPIIEGILEEEEIPDDFKYVAVAESSLLADAVSTSDAVGFWQLKATTAQELGLRVDKEIDERKNIFSSTKAASLYLKRNNLIYKNWISTLFSYTLGATGVSKVVPTDWAYAKEITFDGSTDRYLIKAVSHRIAYEHRLNRLRESNYSIVEFKNAKGKSLADISSMFSIDINELKKFNTWLNASSVPKDKDYSIAILVAQTNLEEIQTKLARQTELKSTAIDSGFPVLKKTTLSTASEDDPIFYEINGRKGILAKPGDDVAALARYGKVKIKDFLVNNDMTDRDFVEEGKVYYLQRKNRKATIPQHVVTSGQGLWDISQMYGIRMKNLLRLNRLKTIQRIQKGRVVWMQKKRPKNQPIEYLNEKEAEVFEKPQIIETYDGKKNEPIPTKDNRKKPTVEEETSKPTEIAVIDPDLTKKDTDDIVVISEDDAPATKDVRNRPPVKEKPKTEEIKYEKPKIESEKPTYIEPKNENVEPSKVVSKTGKSHVVEQGQTLYSVARLYNVSVKDLAAWNSFGTDEKVKIGQEIIVKNPNLVQKPAPAAETKPNVVVTKPSNNSFHEVQKGETLFSISRRYGMTTKQVQDLNGMTDNNVKIGQKLVVKK